MEGSQKMIVLKTLDGEEFVVEAAVASQSGTIKALILDDMERSGDVATVPLPVITASVLARIVEFWKRHAEGGISREDLGQFDKQFVDVEWGLLVELMTAANYLDAKQLMDVTCQAAADRIKDLTVEEVREFFGVVNDFSPEEEEKLRAENSWAFQ